MTEEKRWSDYQDTISAVILDGKAIVVTVKEQRDEEFYDKETFENKLKPVLYFEELEQGLIVSPENRKRLQKIFGDKVSASIGKRIKLECEKVKAFGKVQDVVRVFEFKQDAAKIKDEQLAQLGEVRKLIHDANGTMPAKDTLVWSTEAEFAEILAVHKALLETALAESMP